MGTMTIGPAHGNAHIDGSKNPLPAWCQTNPEEAAEQLQALLNCPAATVVAGPEAGKVMLDTASAYQNWCTESTLGEIIAKLPEDQKAKVSVHTKANNFQLPHKGFSKESVLYQCNGSLERLKIPQIQVYYLHGPDQC